MLKFVSFFLLILLSTMGLNAQDLTKHQWKDRLILIIAEDENNEKFQQQLTQLQKHQKGLKDRKLVIYRILPKKYKIAFQDKNWKNSAQFYKKYKAEESDFRIILIGLDGGEKLDQTKVLSVEKLFNTIDSMPMRQAEMRKNR
ncbi:DUF4174 domain-containing protein [Salegentibacter sp. LM13S]|uniref:DUF4174 domain-containing protein n=1 Tax=Salegentibacter lacus TaxID=2873599 RepID=UPI001CC9358A|nr:DUF4174 domain-containing protein [Salegentibacter lacus]MBZ9632294.1 DUF4174 domain-containing protein [Salegentibacter lacus]